MTIAVTCICHNNFAAEVSGPAGTVCCPLCAAEIPIAAAACSTAAENHLDDETVLPDDLSLRVEKRHEIAEMEMPPPDEADDDAEASYAFLPERRGLFEASASETYWGPGFWAALGGIHCDLPVSCLAYSVGNRLGLIGQGDDVLICSMTAGAATLRFVEHRALVTSVALSRDGMTALSADENGELLWWDLATRRVIHRRQAHTGLVHALAIAPNGEYAATGGADGVVRLWDLAASCRECRLADSHWHEQPTALDFSRAGDSLIAGGGAGRVDCWALDDGRRAHRFHVSESIAAVRGAGGVITALAAPRENNAVAHPTIWRWSVDDGRPVPGPDEWSKPKCVPQCVALDKDGNRLLVAGVLPALAMPIPVAHVVSEIGDAVRDFFSFVPEKLQPSSSSRPRFFLEVWSLATGHRVHAFPPQAGKVAHLAVSPDNTRVLAGLTNGAAQVYAMPGV